MSIFFVTQDFRSHKTLFFFLHRPFGKVTLLELKMIDSHHFLKLLLCYLYRMTDDKIIAMKKTVSNIKQRKK